MTRRQAEIYAYVRGVIAAKGYAPTLQETARFFGLRSLATVHKHLKNLENKGLIERKWNFSRAIVVTGTCPTCGRGAEA